MFLCRAIQARVKGFPRPTLNLSIAQFSDMMNSAFERPLIPPFDPYKNSVNYLLASYLIPYVGLNGYVGTLPKLLSVESRKVHNLTPSFNSLYNRLCLIWGHFNRPHLNWDFEDIYLGQMCNMIDALWLDLVIGHSSPLIE